MTFLHYLVMKEFSINEAYNLILSKLEGWVETLIKMFPNIIMAILVIIVFTLLAKGLKKISTQLTKKFSSNVALNRLTSTIIYVLVVGIGIFTALSVLQLDRALTSLLTGAGIIGLALSFAFQDSASNFISGVFLAIRKPLNVGDIVESQGIMGKVKEMSLRNTLIESFQGQYVYVPNKEVYQNKLINYSQPGERRIDIAVGVSYGDNLKLIEEKLIPAIKNLSFVIRKEEVFFIFDEFGSSSINGKLMFWIKYSKQKDFLDAQSNAIKLIKETFDENGIMIPFPIRTLDFGIKGGEKLSSMISDKASTKSNQ